MTNTCGVSKSQRIHIIIIIPTYIAITTNFVLRSVNNGTGTWPSVQSTAGSSEGCHSPPTLVAGFGSCVQINWLLDIKQWYGQRGRRGPAVARWLVLRGRCTYNDATPRAGATWAMLRTTLRWFNCKTAVRRFQKVWMPRGFPYTNMFRKERQ